MTTNAIDAEMERAPRRTGTFVRMNEGDAYSGVLLRFEWKEEEIIEKVKGKEVLKKVEKPYYTFSLLKPVTLETKKDNPQDFKAGAVVKVQGKGNFNSIMDDFASQELNISPEAAKEDHEEGMKALVGFRFDVKREEDGVLAKGHSHAGKAVQRYDVLRSKSRVMDEATVSATLSGGL
jgi:hypothetical protein